MRRRFSDFVVLRERLLLENAPLDLPPLPPKYYFEAQNFSRAVLEERQAGLESFLRAVLTHPLVRTGPSLHLLHAFLQETAFVP